MNSRTVSTVTLLFLLVFRTVAFPEMTADAILERADFIRGPNSRFTFLLRVTDYRNDRKEYENILRVNVYDISRSLVEYIEPLNDRGKKLLMVKEHYWFYSPLSKKPIRITPQQRMLGQASNGDIAATNYRADYTPKIDGIELMKPYTSGAERMCYRLELKEKTGTATYHRIVYWIERDTLRPLMANFYVRSGMLLKTAYFTDYRMNMGIERPSTMVLINGIHRSQRTEMNYGQYSPSTLPASVYQSSQLAN